MTPRACFSAVAVLLVVGPPGTPSTQFVTGKSLPESKEASAPGCPDWSYGHTTTATPLEHTDDVCNRNSENDPARIEALTRQLRRSVETGHMRHMQDEKTWFCPLDDKPVEDENDEEGPLIGPGSKWIFRNEASTPVVVSWLDTRRDNLEVSAFNPSIYPAHHDPLAVLRPGEWKPIKVFMGHTFQVRELLSVGSELVPGRVLLRHRPGPIPVRNQYASHACPVHALVDPNPHLVGLEEEKEKYQRTPFNHNQLCNSIHRVFINRAGCPIDMYYAGVTGDGDMPSSFISENNGSLEKNKLDSSNSTSPNLSNSCFEKFKFHLGVNPAHSIDFSDRWDSPVAFEATLLGHKFVARLRHNPEVVVDEIIIDRTVIRDCPDRKEKAKYTEVMNEDIREGLGWAEVNGMGEIFNNVLESYTPTVTHNATETNATESFAAEFNEGVVIPKDVVTSSLAFQGKTSEANK